MSHAVINTGTDVVVADFPLPKGCTLKRVDLQCSLIGPREASVLNSFMYGMSGFVIPVLDPDTPVTVELLWDAMVPKDAPNTAGLFDLDTTATDAAPEFEVGEQDLGGILGNQVMNAPREIFRRRHWSTFARNPTGFQQVIAAEDVYVPTDYFKTVIKKPVRAGRHSHIVFAVSSPDLVQPSNTAINTITETEWAMMTFMETVLEDAVKNLLGLVEAGAETPYDVAASFIAKLIERAPSEATAGAFSPTVWNSFTQATFQVDVPGKIGVGTLTSEG